VAIPAGSRRLEPRPRRPGRPRPPLGHPWSATTTKKLPLRLAWPAGGEDSILLPGEVVQEGYWRGGGTRQRRRPCSAETAVETEAEWIRWPARFSQKDVLPAARLRIDGDRLTDRGCARVGLGPVFGR
jgi:hypothetical protein